MAQFVEVPPGQLASQTLHALLEEFASRNGTDYGRQEQSLEVKVGALRHALESNTMKLIYDTESEHWDLLAIDTAARLLDE